MNIKITLMHYIKRYSDDLLLELRDILDKEINRRARNDAQSTGAVFLTNEHNN